MVAEKLQAGERGKPYIVIYFKSEGLMIPRVGGWGNGVQFQSTDV